MDVAKSLSLWKEQPPEQWLRAVNRFAPAAVTAALVLLIAYQLAELTWTVVPHDTFDRPPPVIVQSARAGEAQSSAMSFSALEGSHLFGEASEEAPAPAPVTTEVDAPDTTLSLRLTGVIEDRAGEAGQAIIASGRSEEKKYVVGQTIEGTNARLHAIYYDRVILDRAGQLEALRLPEEDPTGARAAARPAPPPRPAPAEDTSLRTVISNNASQLTDIMRLAPHIEGGQMVGFRVNPGRDRETFESLGLMPGDVVTDINGMTLDDPNRALQVFEALGESTQATLTVVREGAPTVMVIDTTQLQSLSEDRQ